MSSKFTDFNLDASSYASFDATSLRDLIIKRLNDQNIFTDQIFEGSNMSSMIDIVSYAYHVLLFYLNKTSSESMFSDAVVYENMNRIVKLLNYKPVGYRTSTVSFQCTAESALSQNFYTIPRYSFVDVDGVQFSLREDIPFSSTGVENELIATDQSKYLLYQGKYQEYPVHTATGVEFELITLALDKSNLVDHHSIDVYVRDVSTGRYTQWTETESLFLEKPTSTAYELRLNENYRYDVRFGNDINGKKLTPGDQVCIYYVKSDGSQGIIGPNKLKNKSLTLFTTNQFVDIKNDIKTEKTSYVELKDINNIKLDNDTTSTDPQAYETVDDIKTNAPGYFAHQNRLVTTDDFETYINTSFSNIITDVRAVNNKTYVEDHIDYLVNDLSLNNPVLESRLLSNQVNFANSTTFNNVYLYVVPRLEAKKSVSKQSNFLSLAQKEVIQAGIEKTKSLGLEPVFIDPVYMAVDISAGSATGDVTPGAVNTSHLKINKTKNTPRDSAQLKLEVIDIITNYFKHSNMRLGQTIDLSQIHNSILSLNGVESVQTVNNDGTTVSGISLMVWNPVYTQDAAIHNQNIVLPYYKFPYLYDTDGIASRVVVDP